MIVRDATGFSLSSNSTAISPLLDKRLQPLKVIHYEGLVNTDPRRVAAIAKLS